MASSLSQSLAVSGSLGLMAITMSVSLLVGEYVWRKGLAERVGELIRNEDPNQAITLLDQQQPAWWLLPVEQVSEALKPGRDNISNTASWQLARGSAWRTGALERIREAIRASADGTTSPELSALEQERTRRIADEQRLRSTYKLLAAGASELFTLEVEDPEQPKFFRSGIVAGLPALKGLVDGLESPSALSGAVQAAGGKVTQSDFQAAFSAILTNGVELDRNWQSIQNELSEIQSKIRDEQRRLVSRKIMRFQELAKEIESIQPVIQF